LTPNGDAKGGTRKPPEDYAEPPEDDAEPLNDEQMPF
jgi:hypothetical protein